MKPLAIYKKMVREARRLKLPKHFLRDLYKHDREFIHFEDCPLGVFGWVLYDCGTHLVVPGHVDGRKNKMTRVFREVFKTMFKTDRHCYVCEKNGNMREVESADEMIDILQKLED